MRNLIKDERLLEVLKVFKEKLGYDIDAEPVRQDPVVFLASISKQNEKYICHYEVSKQIPHYAWFHELMHVCLDIESGIDYYAYSKKVAHITGVRHINALLAGMFSHRTIWERGEKYGFSEKEHWNNVINNLIQKIHRNPDWGKSVVHQELLISYRALLTADSILSYAHDEAKQDLIRIAEIHQPQALALAQEVCQHCTTVDLFSPEGFDDLPKKLLRIMRLPQEILVPVPRGTPDPDFFLKQIVPILQG